MYYDDATLKPSFDNSNSQGDYMMSGVSTMQASSHDYYYDGNCNFKISMLSATKANNVMVKKTQKRQL